MKTSLGSKVFDTLNYTFLALLAFITLFPFWVIMMSSLVDSTEYYSKTFVFWPSRLNLSAYQYIFGTPWIGTGYKITVQITVLGTLWGMFLTATAAFAMVNPNLPGKTFLNWFFIFTMYFGGGLIPSYIINTKYLGFTDKISAMWFPGGLGVWGFLVLRNFFRGIPGDLRESAMLDGAGEFKILWKIILPLSLPAIATLTLFNAVGMWNSWQGALYYINTNDKQPLQMILRKMVLTNEGEGNAAIRDMNLQYRQLMGGDAPLFQVAVKNATISVAALPIMMLYPFFQKYFAQGVLVGSVKG